MTGVGPQVVVITGASSGIGRQTALAYARRRAHLVLGARSEGALSATTEECRAAGANRVLARSTDISDAGGVGAFFDAATAEFGRIDVVVQSAAVTAFGRFEDVPSEIFDEIVRTNLIGAANVARSALVHFQERGSGHLVLVGSLLGVTAAPYQSAYVASKFGLCGLVRSLRQENRHASGIKVHGIYPGPVDTPIYGAAGNYTGRTPRVPPTAVAPSAVVAAIVRATGSSRSSERQVGWLNRPAILAYRLLPSMYDIWIAPLLRAVAFTSEPAKATRGNALAKADD